MALQFPPTFRGSPDRYPARAKGPSIVAWKTNLAHVILVWAYRGSATARVGERVIQLAQGQALWIPALLPRSIEHPAGSVVVAIPVPLQDAGPDASELRHVAVPEGQSEWALYYAMGTLTPLRPKAFSVREVARLVGALPTLAGAGLLPPPRMPRHPAARNIAATLLANPRSPLTLAGWAGLTRCHERTLRRAFVQDTGEGFTAWRRRCRVHLAHQLLRGGATPDAAGRETGLGGTAGLRKAHRALMGDAPLPSPDGASPKLTAEVAAAFSRTPPAATAHWEADRHHHTLLWVFRGRCQVTMEPGGAGGSGRTVGLRRGECVWLPAGTAFSARVDGGSLAFPLYFRATEGVLGPASTPARDRSGAREGQRFSTDERWRRHAVWRGRGALVPPADLFGSGPRLPLRIPTAWEETFLHHVISQHTDVRPYNYDHTSAIPQLQALPGFPGLQLPSDPAALRICRALRRDPRNPLGLEAWGAELNVSARTLQRVFLRETGLGFAAWVRTCRLEAAAAVLDAGVGVARAAAYVGYTDATAFTRAFSRHFGHPPSDRQPRPRNTSE